MTELVFQFIIDGYHFWPDAPEKYKEFRQSHRHLFRFVCKFEVMPQSYIDRTEELWELRQNTIEKVFLIWGTDRPNICDFKSLSVEGIAELTKENCHLSSCFVGEDENFGAIIS